MQLARSRSRNRRVTIGALAFFVIACSGENDRDRASVRRREAERIDRPNVLLISLDACRADALSCFGNKRDTSPFIDSLAARGTRFSRAFVNTHGTPSSHTTMLSSTYQQDHLVFYRGGNSAAMRTVVPTSLVMLPEVLKAFGYQTIAVTGGAYMSRTYGFDHGFMEFHDTALGIEEETSALRWLIKRQMGAGRPVFAFLHTYEIHSPYRSPQKYLKQMGVEKDLFPTDSDFLAKRMRQRPSATKEEGRFLRLRYDAGVRYTDDTLARFFRALGRMGFLDDCLVVVTADHGEEFLEHGSLLHGASLYEELLHVPLIFQGYRIPIGRTVESLVSSVDIVPTILARLQIRIPLPFAGSDILDPALPSRPVLAQYGSLLYGVRETRWKLILHTKDGLLQLIDLASDPGEQCNVALEHPSIVGRLLGELHPLRHEVRRQLAGVRRGRPSQRINEELEELGYAE